MKIRKNQLAILMLSFLAIIIAYYFLDKPLVFFASQHHLRNYSIFDLFTKIPIVFAALAFLFYIYLGIQFVFFRIEQPWLRSGLLFSNSIAITIFIKDFLKKIFGRYWPDTWHAHNLSLLKDHAYGFNFFHSQGINLSFPSGHAAVTIAGTTVLWFLFPRLRWLALLLSSIIVIGLLATYYHFLSDILAGGLLGWFVACCTKEVSISKKFIKIDN